MSALNRELLEASAELFLEVAGRASTPDDPAAHFDLFPARGRETRSEADSFLSRRIPELASRRAFIPDADGALRVAEHFHGALDTDDDQVQPEGVRDWQESVSRSDVPHWRCYQTSTRRTRLRALLRATDEAGRGRSETTAAVWLRELAMVRDQKAILAALDILANVPRRAGSLPEIFSSPVIPLEGGGWARAAESSRVLLAEPGSVVPEGLPIVDRALSSVPEIRAVLRGLGFQGVSIDQTATALTAGIRSSWGEAEWERYWSALTSASPASGIRAMREAVDAGRAIKVRDRTGTWRTASSVFADQRIAAENDALHADPAIHRGRGDLLAAAGCLTGADSSADLSDDLVYTRWRSHVTSHLEARLAAQNARLLEIHWPTAVGTGPLSLLHDLQDDHQALTAWSAEIIRNLDTQKLSIGFTVSTGAKGATDVVSPALWALTEYGRVQTTLGSLPFAVALGPSMSGYGAFLPVMADFDLALALSLPKDLASAPDSAIEFAFRRSDYMLEADGLERLTETLLQAADRKKFTRSAKLPAVSPDGQIRIVGRSSVVLALSPDDALELRADGTSYLPCSKTAAARLADQWGLRTSEEVLRRALEIIEGAEEVPLLDVFPALPRLAGDADLSRYKVRSSPRIVRKIQGPNGMREKELLGIEQGDLLTIDESLDEIGVLSQVSQLLQLRLSDEEIHRVIDLGQQLRVNDLVGRVRAAGSDVEKILLLADAEQLGGLLPDGLLASVRQRKGAQSDREVAELYLTVRGYDALLMLKETMVGKGIQVPQQWAGSPEAQRLVASLGFATAFAGAKARNPLPVEHVLGKVELAPLHDFQEEIANGVRTIALERSTDGQAARALLNLPTGAGKTRVAVESIVRLLVSDELRVPVLWIAQSEELCEQAIASWMEVWRAVGDRRVMEISRFFGGRELDESIQDVHIVVATDDQLLARINSPQADMYGWLSEPGIVVIDEAHTAGSRGYTEILRWLGLTAARTDRPLIGLTATAYRGRNDETNRLFANRFGARRIDAPSLGDEPIAELRRREVLAEVDHRVLTGMNVPLDATADKEFFRLKEVTKSMLDRIGQDLDRTQMLVDDILKQDPDWPILVFAPSVVSAHTVAALLRLEGREDAAAVDGSMRMPERRRVIEKFKAGETRILVNCELLTQGFDAPKTRALYIARPTFSPNRYHQMIGRGLRGPRNGGKERCLIVNVEDTFDQFGERLAFTEFDHLWSAG